MRLIRTVLVCGLGAQAVMFAAPAREILELQRDMATLQDQVKTLQRTLEERMAALQSLIQQNVELTNKSTAAVEAGIRDRMAEQAKSLTGPVANMNVKLDQMANEFQNVSNHVADLTSQMSKLQAQLVDLGNAVKTINAPPPPPPGAGSTGAGMSGAGGATTPPPGMSAQQVYDSAMRDRSGGSFDLAMQGFNEYLKYYGSTELAPNAQFYIGQIYYDKNDFSNALQAFDAVLERFPENPKTADAMYMKGMALLKSGQRTEAAREFLNVIQKFPTAEVAAKARTQRRALGLSVPAAAPAPRRATRRG